MRPRSKNSERVLRRYLQEILCLGMGFRLGEENVQSGLPAYGLVDN